MNNNIKKMDYIINKGWCNFFFHGATKVSQAFSRLHNSAAALPMIAALSSAPKFAYKYRKISQISENVFTNIEKFAYKYVYGCLQICFKWRKIWLQICLIPNIYLKVPGSTLKYSDVPQSNLKVPRCDEIPAFIYLAKHASLIKLFISQYICTCGRYAPRFACIVLAMSNIYGQIRLSHQISYQHQNY